MSQNQESHQNNRQEKRASIEALLFATNGMTLSEISARTGIKVEEVESILDELEADYNSNERGIHITLDGDLWKMSIKPGITLQVKDLLPPELPSSLTKTLAIIAAKKPIKQSTVVKIRGNKAYDHIKKLQKLGFVVSSKNANTLLLDVTQKFFDYFRINEGDFKAKINLSKDVAEKLETLDNETELPSSNELISEEDEQLNESKNL